MCAVEALRLILLYVHLIGFALLLGGSIAQYVSRPAADQPGHAVGRGDPVADRARPLRAAARRRRAGAGETRDKW